MVGKNLYEMIDGLNYRDAEFWISEIAKPNLNALNSNRNVCDKPQFEFKNFMRTEWWLNFNFDNTLFWWSILRQHTSYFLWQQKHIFFRNKDRCSNTQTCDHKLCYNHRRQLFDCSNRPNKYQTLVETTMARTWQ